MKWVHPNVLMNAFMNKQMWTKCDSDICMYLHVSLTGKHADVYACAKSITLNESPAFPVGCLIVTITKLSWVFASMQEKYLQKENSITSQSSPYSSSSLVKNFCLLS